MYRPEQPQDRRGARLRQHLPQRDRDTAAWRRSRLSSPTSPSTRKTAHYLALDLARRFVSDAPSKALVDRLAAVYLKNDTAIVPMLRALFSSPEFTHSVGQKYRRPLEHTVATIRALGISAGRRVEVHERPR